MESERLITEQLAYYRARASEYDAWFLRQGRFDRGEVHAAQWLAEVGVLEPGKHKSNQIDTFFIWGEAHVSPVLDPTLDDTAA